MMKPRPEKGGNGQLYIRGSDNLEAPFVLLSFVLALILPAYPSSVALGFSGNLPVESCEVLG
jgi:hypothetical protein